MGNVLCVPKGRKKRGLAEGAKDKKRVTNYTRKTRRCQSSVEIDSHSLDTGDELLVQRNGNQVTGKDYSAERCRSISDSRTLSTDSVPVQSSLPDHTSALSPGATCVVGEVSIVLDTCKTVEAVRAANLAVSLSPNATQGFPEHENGQISLVQSIAEPQYIELDKVSITNESTIPAFTSTDSLRTTENITNGQSPHTSKDLHSKPEALEIESTQVHNDTDNSEKHIEMTGDVSVIQTGLETTASKPLTNKVQESLEGSDDPSSNNKETTEKNMTSVTFQRRPGYDKSVSNKAPVSLKNSTSFSKNDAMNIVECGKNDAIQPSENCNKVDITYTKESYHGNGDTDTKNNLNGKDSEPSDTIVFVALTTQTKTSTSGIRPARSNKSSPETRQHGDVPGKRSPGSAKTNSDSKKRNSLLKKQLIQAVKRNQELSVLHNKDKHLGLIPRAKSFYRENNMGLIPRAKSFYRDNNILTIKDEYDKLCTGTQFEEPVRKVSDFEIPELPPHLPDMPMELNTKTHVYKIPDVARSDAQKKITWRQTEYQSSTEGQAWASRTPVFQPPIQPLGERVLDMFGSVDRMKKSWVIPECRQIETLKLEHCIYPGLYVYPHMRWRYTMDITNTQDTTKRRRDRDKPRTNTVGSRHNRSEQQSKARPKAKSGGLTRWSRYDNLNNLHKDRH